MLIAPQPLRPSWSLRILKKATSMKDDCKRVVSCSEDLATK